jgi:UDP-N-acetylglucosamine diphosphorylase/glucosamine-1-phosphate N-acetyltransferase
MINVCIFEDQGYKNLLPLTYMRPAYELLLGIDTIFDKSYRFFNYANITLHCRKELKSSIQQKHKEITINRINIGAACLFINGRVLMDDRLFEIISSINKKNNYLFTYQQEVVMAYVQGDLLKKTAAIFQSIPSKFELIRNLRTKCITKELSDVIMIRELWDLISYNKQIICSDFNYKNHLGIIKGDIYPFVSIYNENNVFIDKNTTVNDFVVINGNKGPIYIEKDVHINPGTYLEGPLFIGRETKIYGGKIKNSSIGPACRINGELSDSIILGYSNKAHSGFLGHSYLGEWVNLGALTTTSNLKNTYGPIAMDNGLEKIQTNQTFLGTIFGDFVKTGIGSLLNTGTIVGLGSNIYGANVHPKYIAPFSWGEANKYLDYELNKFLEVSERMMKRRNQQMKQNIKELLIKLYKDIQQTKALPIKKPSVSPTKV